MSQLSLALSARPSVATQWGYHSRFGTWRCGDYTISKMIGPEPVQIWYCVRYRKKVLSTVSRLNVAKGIAETHACRSVSFCDRCMFMHDCEYCGRRDNG